ncbi:hypothetical protein [Catenulispora pinistramenti]|uniref:hypothetical protein n=1 Tax=Catenulispora pinistramenti TaxID=2705254 RepID=UPI001BA50A36|nr:hypothetical protein [Catenulispora pinistramenti]
MNEQYSGVTPVFRGTEHEVGRRLRELHLAGAESYAVDRALQQVQEGNRHIICEGEEFEVLDQEWSIVQDVYGCPDGRDCRNISRRQRRRFEATIRARVQSGE